MTLMDWIVVVLLIVVAGSGAILFIGLCWNAAQAVEQLEKLNKNLEALKRLIRGA